MCNKAAKGKYLIKYDSFKSLPAWNIMIKSKIIFINKENGIMFEPIMLKMNNGNEMNNSTL